MTITLNGTTGITTPAITNNGTLTQTGVATLSSTLQSASTIGVGGATPAASGAGITFPATQSASSSANTLDDYEEGSFTPVLQFGGLSAGQTYLYQTGRYVKIGKNVYINLYIYMSDIGTSTGNARIAGLPFPTESVSGYDYYIPAGMRNKFTLTSGSLPYGYIGQGYSEIDLYQTSTSGGGPFQLTKSSFANLFEVNFNFWYVTSS